LKIVLFCLIFVLNLSVHASLPSVISAENLLTHQKTTLSTKLTDKKGLVLIFMSAKCPCSDSHVPLIKKLATTYKDFKFSVIHSNLDETRLASEQYFKKANFNFEVLEDSKTQIADLLGAYKTPHAFVFNPQGEILYQGGVTNSSNAANADEFFLDNALSDISKGQKVRTAEGRTLGCVILRQSEIK
ncbi:MAG: redoxin domain-containing protein, partial [Pseudobdellovibrio sp.]